MIKARVATNAEGTFTCHYFRLRQKALSRKTSCQSKAQNEIESKTAERRQKKQVREFFDIYFEMEENFQRNVICM